jgi:serine/threonine-protein kinase
VLDIGDDPHGLFLVMEYIEGDTLSGLVRRAGVAGTRLDPAVSLRILFDGLAGLHAAHELADDEGRPLDLVHRDFSPQNILVGVDGVGRLSDFGIAKAASRLGATRTGMVKGKISYMAPEQARGQRVDRRCDVWAAGVLAWEILAGRQLYVAAADEIGLLFRIATEVPPRLSEVSAVPPAVADVVARALTPAVEARIPTAAAFARELFDAIRSSSIDVAEPPDVATVVSRLCAAKLADRRIRVKEVLSRRAARLDHASADPADVVTQAISAPVSVRNPPSRTDVSAVASPSAMPAPLPLPPRSKAPLVVVVAGAALLGAGVLVHAMSGEPAAAPPPGVVEASAPATHASVAPSATVEPSESAPPSAAESASAPLATPSATAAASASVRPIFEPPKPPASAARKPKHHDSFLDDQY